MPAASKQSLQLPLRRHNYRKSPIGNGVDIENVPSERLRAFCRKYYQPDNAILMIAGGGFLDKKFGRIPPPGRS